MPSRYSFCLSPSFVYFPITLEYMHSITKIIPVVKNAEIQNLEDLIRRNPPSRIPNRNDLPLKIFIKTGIKTEESENSTITAIIPINT